MLPGGPEAEGAHPNGQTAVLGSTAPLCGAAPYMSAGQAMPCHLAPERGPGPSAVREQGRGRHATKRRAHAPTHQEAASEDQFDLCGGGV